MGDTFDYVSLFAQFPFVFVIAFLWRLMRESSLMADAARSIWQPARTIRIKRMEPIVTAGGKHMLLYVQPRHSTAKQAIA